ncbi:MalY/PatB family protein [Gudongella sp. DL1XJH-153]|uniref:MalY/PatB family protein n=1 Tax=Gudongella sp. DL1XJH-153 TaxID=3409804 RepID=UPI003BB54959
MTYNFDEIIDRSGTYSAKWDKDVQEELFGESGLLPYWVADMEFKAAPEILDALGKRVEHGIFGYTARPSEYYQLVIDWTKKRFGWDIEREWMLFTPGIVPGTNYVIQALTEEGEGVIINEPVYYPFSNSIKENRREVVNSPLVLKDNRYYIDFEDFEEKAKDPNNKLFILCSPHNPVSRVWSEDELRRVGEICLENNVYVLSDEIHNDLILGTNKHTMFASVDKRFEETSITATSTTKTFNLAGFYASNIIIPNKKIRDRVEKVLLKNSIGSQGPLSVEAVMAAYRYGEPWLEELLKYLQENVVFTRKYLKERLTDIDFTETEGTYLMWIDFRAYEKDGKTLEKVLVEKGGVALDGGTWFGDGGDGFMRLNIAAPRKFLEEGLDRVAKAIKEEYID